MSSSVLISGGRIIDPAQAIDTVGDVLIESGKIRAVFPAGTTVPSDTEERIDATGLIVCPGFVDVHSHLRYPGFPDKETIATGTEAAVRGGFTTICAMANTNPAVDSAAVVEDVHAMVARESHCQVHVVGAVSRGLRGHENTDARELLSAGIVCLSDDGNPVMDTEIMAKALGAGERFGVPVSAHEETRDGSERGSPNPCWNCSGESDMVRRDIDLVRRHGGHLHIAHVSCAASVDAIAEARASGISITAEVTPHHLNLALCAGEDGEALYSVLPCGHDHHGYPLPFDLHDGAYKVNPPLRSPSDVRAVRQALADGIINIIATDHAPHTLQDKEGGMDGAAFGFTGFELALPLVLNLVVGGELDLPAAIAALTINPARAFNLKAGSLEVGRAADVCIFDPNSRWTVQPSELASRGKNTPLMGQTLSGRPVATIAGGRIHRFNSMAARA